MWLCCPFSGEATASGDFGDERSRREQPQAPHNFGKFDGSGVSGSRGRGRSQALESKVRFADNHTGTRDLTFSPSG